MRTVLFDLDSVADELRRRGIPALTEHAGGNNYALFGGDPVNDDVEGPRYRAVVGPAFLDTDSRVHAWRDDCTIGSERDDDVHVDVPADATESEVADLVQQILAA